MCPGCSHGSDGCKISMLWNWTTIDACFLAKSWRITSSGMFAGSCIGVMLLVIALEFLRRLSRDYDRYLVRAHLTSADGNAGRAGPASSRAPSAGATIPNSGAHEGKITPTVTTTIESPAGRLSAPPAAFRPSILQQAVRSGLHMLQFAVAYFVMLLAMYYNGYILICIFIGAYLGAFVFQWETIFSGHDIPSASQEATVCCG